MILTDLAVCLKHPLEPPDDNPQIHDLGLVYHMATKNEYTIVEFKKENDLENTLYLYSNEIGTCIGCLIAYKPELVKQSWIESDIFRYGLKIVHWEIL